MHAAVRHHVKLLFHGNYRPITSCSRGPVGPAAATGQRAGGPLEASLGVCVRLYMWSTRARSWASQGVLMRVLACDKRTRTPTALRTQVGDACCRACRLDAWQCRPAQLPLNLVRKRQRRTERQRNWQRMGCRWAQSFELACFTLEPQASPLPSPRE